MIPIETMTSSHRWNSILVQDRGPALVRPFCLQSNSVKYLERQMGEQAIRNEQKCDDQQRMNGSSFDDSLPSLREGFFIHDDRSLALHTLRLLPGMLTTLLK